MIGTAVSYAYQVEHALLHAISYTYNSVGQITSYKLPSPAGTASFGYTGPGITSIIDPLSNVTRLNADGAGRAISKSLPAGQTSCRTYDADDQISQTTHPPGSTTTFAYDPNGNMTARTVPLSHSTTYEYDLSTRRTRIHWKDHFSTGCFLYATSAGFRWPLGLRSS